MDRAKITLLRKEIEEALIGVATKHNLTVRTGNAKFTMTTVNIALEIAEKNADGIAETREVHNLKTMGKMFGLPDNAYLMHFDSNGHRYELRGLNPNAVRYQLIAVDLANGKEYRLPLSAIKSTIPSALAVAGE